MARTKNEPVIPEPIPLPPEEKPSQAENIISIILGLAVVLVIGAMVINAIRGRNNQQQANNTPPETKQEATASGTHTVAAGETLWSIAEKYYNDGYKWTEIQKANNLPAQGGVEVGTSLVIPTVAPSPTQLAQAPEVSPTVAVSPTAMPTVTPSPAQDTGSTGPTGGAEAPKSDTLSASTDKEYMVKAGDTLWSIAVAKYNNGYKWVDIARANNLKNPDVIHTGNKFQLP